MVGASVGVTSDVIAVGVGGASDGGGVGSIVVVGTGVGTVTGVAVRLGKTTATVGSGVGAIVGTTVGAGVGAGLGVAAGVAERNSQMLLASDVSTFTTTVVPALPRLATHGSGDACPDAPRQSPTVAPSLSTMRSAAAA